MVERAAPTDANVLVLGENGKLYDSKKGQALPDGVAPMPLLTDDELAMYAEPGIEEVLPNYVARYWDLMALAAKTPAKVIGPDAVLRDRPGFDLDFITRGSIPETAYSVDAHEILMVMRGHWSLRWDGGETTLAPGDTAAIPPGLSHAVAPAMSGEASLYRATSNDDAAGPTHIF